MQVRPKILLFVLLLRLPTARGQLGAVTNFFREADELGIFRFQNFFSDSYNLYFGKRRLQCALKIQRLIANSGPQLEGGYRDDSLMILPEAGPYVGNDAILEYVRFADAAYSPYVKEGPLVRSESPMVVGYDGRGQCEYRYFQLNAYTMDEKYVGSESHFALPVLTRVFLDYDDEYMKSIFVFYTKPFLQWFFGDQLSTRAVAEFVCNDAMGSPSCVDATGPPPENCVDKFMDNLPLTDPNFYVDGNSRSCRILHATFVAQNPSHCEHVTLTPSDVDPKGAVKCSVSYQLQHSRFFEEADMEQFRQFQIDHGIDPTLGYKTMSAIDENLV